MFDYSVPTIGQNTAVLLCTAVTFLPGASVIGLVVTTLWVSSISVLRSLSLLIICGYTVVSHNITSHGATQLGRPSLHSRSETVIGAFERKPRTVTML